MTRFHTSLQGLSINERTHLRKDRFKPWFELLDEMEFNHTLMSCRSFYITFTVVLFLQDGEPNEAPLRNGHIFYFLHFLTNTHIIHGFLQTFTFFL